MANTIKTRIQLRYFEYSDLTAVADRILLAGEVAAVHIPADTTTITENGESKSISTAPTVLFKVGDGVRGQDGTVTGTAFKDLTWLSALAADVHSWAKADWNTFLTNLHTAIDAGYVKVADFDTFKSNVIGTSTDELTASTIFGKIAELEDIADAADTLSKANKTALDILNGSNTVTGSVAAQVKVAVDAADAAQDTADEALTKANANAEAISKLDDTYATDAELKTAKDTLESQIKNKANTADVYTTEQADAKFETITNVQTLSGKVDTLQTWTSTTGATKDDVNKAKTSLIGTTADNEDSDTITGAKKYADTKVAALVDGAPETLDTLNELAAALKDNAGIVDILNQSIGEKAAQADLDEHIADKNNPHGITAAQVGAYTKAEVDTIVGALPDTNTTYTFTDGTNGTFKVTPAGGSAQTVDTGAKTYADTLNDAMNTRVTELEKVDHEHTSSLEAIEDAVAKKHEHTADMVEVTPAQVATWNAAEQNAKDYANTLNDAMDTRVNNIENNYVKVKDDQLVLGESNTVLIICGGTAADVWDV